MKFENKDRIISETDIKAVEFELELEFPDSLRILFLQNNGGDPSPYIFENDTINVAVNETLPLVSSEGRGTAVHCYKQLVISRSIVPINFFPFAVDPGGDYFFIDCSSKSGMVYFYRSDSALGPRLLGLDLGLNQFWENLIEEE